MLMSSFLDLNLLKSVCISQPSPSTIFPVSPRQIFTLYPPASYPTTASHASSSHGMSKTTKLAIGITIPIVFIIFCSAFGAYWYIRYKRHSTGSHSRFDPHTQHDERWGDPTITGPLETPSKYRDNYPLKEQRSHSHTEDVVRKGKQMEHSTVETTFAPPPTSAGARDSKGRLKSVLKHFRGPEIAIDTVRLPSGKHWTEQSPSDDMYS